MVFYEILAAVPEGYGAEWAAAWMVGVKLGAGALVGSLENGLAGASWQGTAVGGGRLISCSGTWHYRVVQVTGGGTTDGRDWSLWRLTDWGDDREPLTAAVRAALQGRHDFLTERLAEWDRLHALKPWLPMRPMDAERAELAELHRRLEPVGALYIVRHIGYGRRVGPGEYVWGGGR